jgi:hypothetical protein
MYRVVVDHLSLCVRDSLLVDGLRKCDEDRVAELSEPDEILIAKLAGGLQAMRGRPTAQITRCVQQFSRLDVAVAQRPRQID